MMIAGMASRKQPTTRNTNGDEEAGGRRTHAPGGTPVEDRLRDLVVGEQPAEHARRADAEQRDAGELAGIEQRLVQALQVHLAIDEQRERAGIEHRDAGGLGRGEPAEDLAADDDAAASSAPARDTISAQTSARQVARG